MSKQRPAAFWVTPPLNGSTVTAILMPNPPMLESPPPIQGCLEIGGVTLSQAPVPLAERTLGGSGRRQRLKLLTCPLCGAQWHTGSVGSAAGFVAAAADAHVRTCDGTRPEAHAPKVRRKKGRLFTPAKVNRTFRLSLS